MKKETIRVKNYAGEVTATIKRIIFDDSVQIKGKRHPVFEDQDGFYVRHYLKDKGVNGADQ